MNRNDVQRTGIFRFGIRHAIACTFAFAGLFYVAVPRYPPAPTVPLQKAWEQVRANNIESAVFYRGQDFADLITKVSISVGGNELVNRVRVSRPGPQFASELETAGITFAIQGTPPTIWVLGFGTGIIMLLAMLYLTIMRHRQSK